MAHRPTNDAAPAVEAIALPEDSVFPNDVALPPLVYRNAFDGAGDLASLIERTFEEHGWSNGWRDGVFDYHHYHSTAHEVLGCFSGHARVQLGGPHGPELDLHRGDVLIIPAGVAHRRIHASSDFKVVGAYAHGADYDMNRGKPGERPETDRRIARVRPPGADPVQGARGPLLDHWNRAHQ